MVEPIKLKDLAKLCLNLDGYSSNGTGTNYVVAKIIISKDLDGKYEDAKIEPLDILDCDMQYAQSVDLRDVIPELITELETGIYGFHLSTTVSRDYEGDYDEETVCNYSEKFALCPVCGDIIDNDMAIFPALAHPLCKKHKGWTLLQATDAIIANATNAFMEKLMTPVEENPIINSIYLEGNNGGDFLNIQQTQKQIDENTCHIEVGHCCVIPLRAVVPVEYLTALLNQQVMNTPLMEDGAILTDIHRMVHNVVKDWSPEFANSLVAKARRTSWLDSE